MDDCRECREEKAAERGLDEGNVEEDNRDWKRRSNGRSDGVGLNCRAEARDPLAAGLPGEESSES